jgi:hypothetical protein
VTGGREVRGQRSEYEVRGASYDEYDSWIGDEESRNFGAWRVRDKFAAGKQHRLRALDLF